MKYFLLLIVLLLSRGSYADSGEIIIEGIYQGKNLFIQNPYCGEKQGFSVQEIIVNNKVLMADIKSSAFEIDLSGLRMNEPVAIKLIHREGCKPKIINLQAILVNIPFEFSLFSVRPDSIVWETKGENAETVYFVERYLNNKWVAITPPISATGPAENAAYLIKTKHDLGDNKYRIKSLTSSGQVFYSAEKEYRVTEETASYRP